MKNFIECWRDKGDEKSDTQKFWLSLLRDVLEIEYPEQFIEFEKQVTLEHKSFIDAYIAGTRVLIEQKSYGIDLAKKRLISEAGKINADGVYGVQIANPQVAGGAAEIIIYGTAFKFI